MDDKGEKRKGRQFIINKRASGNALSPNPNDIRVKRLSGIPDVLRKSNNVKNRRLRSQEANIDGGRRAGAVQNDG